MADNGLEHALKAIDPVARAMLDLSIRRRLPDSSIADLAQMPPDELVRWRGDVLDELASQIGLTGPQSRDEVRNRLEEIDPSAWVGSETAARPSEPKPPEKVKPEPKAAPEPEAAPKPKTKSKPKPPPPPKRERERPSGRLLALLALLVVVVIVVAAISLSGEDEPSGTNPPPATTTEASTTTTEQTTTTTEPASEPVELAPLPGMPDRGTATVTISGSEVEVQLKGMPDPRGVYELWLYTTLIGAHPLGTADSGDATISARLPKDASDFTYLDLSREDSADDPIHSGISVRRAELAPLLAGE